MVEKFEIQDLIGAWQSRKELADQIGASVDAVHKWARSNRIPSSWQARVVEAAQAKGMKGVTAEWMIRAHDRQGSAA